MGILGQLELPIVFNPTEAGPVAAQLAAAVSEAGGLGFVRARYCTTEGLRENVLAARAMTSRPFGVDVFVGGGYSADPERTYAYALRLAGEGTTLLGRPRFNDDALRDKLRALLADPVAVVSLTSGLPPQGVIHDLRRAGSEVWLSVTSVDEAREAAALGADALIVDEAQARTARDLSLLAALQLIGPAVKLPLVAAGSIVTGAGVAAVLAAGASAAQLSSVHLRAPARADTLGEDVDGADLACHLAADAQNALYVAAHKLFGRRQRSRS